MRCDGLRIFNRTAVFQIGRDPGGPKRVATRAFRKSGDARSAFDHAECIAARHRLWCQPPIAIDGAEEGTFLVTFDVRRRKVGIEIRLSIMMGRDLMAFSTFLVESEPPAFTVLKVVLHLHRDGGRDTCETINHHADEGPVAKTSDTSRIDGIDQGPGLRSGKNGSFSAFH